MPKKPQVAPYSGAILASVARSARLNEARPGPKYSTKRPTTPLARSICVAVSTRSVAVRSEEHTSELQSLMRTSYAVVCLKKKTHYHMKEKNDKTKINSHH